ncbi:competence protein CoiA [Lederbergia wuyishanensis]|uniref:Competence CoiA-like predicted nuclease n=1 Tax=Lederbergia wuyishanensis TaxID=1347903 RepID=A0ABU0CYZ6_9BACI|nr:competence protein CoiA family protein [Lederbergia wuyishanensis]MCJ8006002.1 hypothetical protein [Lederbergia wuyishanensis]MDQ0341368.1 competence CoiA-like predicted nuclease [Lederbergia wuyishanensis]
MLTALNKEGKQITLVKSFHNKEIIERMRSEKYFCPICKESLILKAGHIRIPHFSHTRDSLCATFLAEPESPQHLKGKKNLFDFFMNEGLNVSLEHYLPEIKQRADLFVQFQSHSFAIEYQCSPLSRSILEKRTKGYKSIGIEPLWIIGGKPYQKSRKDIYLLSDFNWAMLRRKRKGGRHLLSYDTESKKFYLLSNITSFSQNKVSATLFSRQISTATLPLRFPQTSKSINHTLWLQNKRKWLHHKVQNGNLVNDLFLKNIYTSGHNPFLLPPICGLPVQYMENFYSHPIEWQFLIYLECLRKIQVGKRISLKYIYQKIQAWEKAGLIVIRNFPLDQINNWRNAVENYFSLLTELEYFSNLGEDLFEKEKQIKIPHSIEEATLWEDKVFQKLNNRSSNDSEIDESCFLFEYIAGFSKFK